MARWLIAPVLVAAVVVIVVVAGQTSTVPAGMITQAADVTGHVAGADLGGSVDVNAAGRSINMSLSGYESLARHDGTLTFRINGAPGISGSAAAFRMRFLYPVVYMSSPLFASALPAGKQWLRFNVASLLRQQGVNPTVLSSAQSDPAQYLQYLKAVSGQVQNLGTETIRGVETTHYHAVSDLSRYASLLPASERATAQRAYSRLEQITGAKRIPMDVWIDSHHLVRQMRVNLTTHPSSGTLAGQPVNETLTVDLFNFGPKPGVAAPPASQTEDLSALTGGP
jgi:hypothetical protein